MFDQRSSTRGLLAEGTPLRRRLRRLVRPAWLGTLRRTAPLSSSWGIDRGTPVDRYYIERFLEQHRADIRGAVLEIGDPRYCTRFGTQISRCDVLDVAPGNPRATIIADLGSTAPIAEDRFDCIILTQTLQFILDVRVAIEQLHRMLCRGGVLLASVPSVSRLDGHLASSDFWRFTPPVCRALFEPIFGAQVEITAYGNVLTDIAFLTGLAAEELSEQERSTVDASFPLLVTIRAVKG